VLTKAPEYHRCGGAATGRNTETKAARTMPTLIAGIIAVALIYAALNIIKGADPKFLARIIRSGGGVD